MPPVQAKRVWVSPVKPKPNKGVRPQHKVRIGLPRHKAWLTNRDRPTILWIDDYELGLSVYKSVFEEFGFRILTSANPIEGLDLALSRSIDAVVVDYEMPEMDGGTLASHIKRHKPVLPVVMFSGSDVPGRFRNVVDGFCDKAGSHEKLLAILNRLLLRKPDPALQPRPLRAASQHQTIAA